MLGIHTGTLEEYEENVFVVFFLITLFLFYIISYFLIQPKKGDLVYAELADLDDSTNDEKVAQKPAPYESTVYADVVPTDVYHKASPDPSDPTYANVQSTGV